MNPEQEELVVAHMGLVGRIANLKLRSMPGHVRFEDLQAAGNLGLVEAAARFDPSRGVPFGSFAARRIDGAIRDYLRGGDWVTRERRRVEREQGLERDNILHLPDYWDAASLDDIERDVIDADETRRLRAAIARLPERQRVILTGELHGRRLVEFAARFGCTRARISQLRTDALSRLRACLVDAS